MVVEPAVVPGVERDVMQLDGTVVVGECLDEFEANLAEATLRAERIPVSIRKDSRHSMMGRGLLGPGTRGADPLIQLVVREEDAELAERLLASVKTRPLGEGEPEVDEWAAQVAHRSTRLRRGKRAWVLLWIYGLFAVAVVALVLTAIGSAT